MEGQTLPMAHDLGPAETGSAQLRLEGSRRGGGQGEDQGLASGIARLGLAVERLAARLAPLFQPVGVLGIGGHPEQGPVEDRAVESEQARLVDEPAGFDQAPGAGLALRLLQPVLFELQLGALLAETGLAFGEGGAGLGRCRVQCR